MKDLSWTSTMYEISRCYTSSTTSINNVKQLEFVSDETRVAWRVDALNGDTDEARLMIEAPDE